LLAAGLQFDGDKLPADFRRVDVGVGPYTDPTATARLIEANAVIGLVARQRRIGATCALCHARADDRIGSGVGRRLDGVPNTALAVGQVVAWGTRSRSYLPFVNVSGVGTGPRVSLETAMDPDVIEAAVDAALRAWPRGQADILPDGVGNPTDIPSLFALRAHGPYLWDGAFAKATDTSHYFATIVFDPTTLATRWGRGFLVDGPFWPVGESLSDAYQRVVQAIDPTESWPRAAISRMSVFKLFHDAMDAGFRVDRGEIDTLTWYLGSLLPPDGAPGDAHDIDAGRRVFRAAGCDACHLEAPVSAGAVASLATLVPGYRVAAGGGENETTGYDDRIALTAGEDSIDRRGYKVPSLLGLWLSAPYLHDGSVPTLNALFDPARGEGAPHPYYVDGNEERSALAAFLNTWDGRKYP
jgi:mono/diheme cytochrome c family protein